VFKARVGRDLKDYLEDNPLAGLPCQM